MTLAELADLTPAFITGFAVVAVLSEWLTLVLTHRVAGHREGVVSFLSAALAFFPLFLLTKLVFLAVMFWLYDYRLFDPGFAWYVWPLALVAYDFMFWVVHWLSHNVRLFWCIHSVHHTPQEMNLTVAFRGSLLDFVTIPHTILWLPLLGFHPFVVLIVEAVGRLYGILVHVNERWFPNRRRSWVDKLLVTPSTHRVHHSTNHAYLDRNYGETLAVWDLLFGTYQPELATETPVYGVSGNPNSENLLDSQTHELRALWRDLQTAPRWKDKLGYLFRRPGWHHLTGGTSAAGLRERALRRLAGDAKGGR